jgi:LCP family protein required for cell wall assembly
MNDKDFYENDRDSIRYEGRRVHHEEGFFERNCDEAWEQVKETFSHPGRLFAKVLLIALLCGVVAGGSYLLKIRAPELPNKGDAQKDPNQTQVDEIDYGDGVRPRADGERKSKDFYTVLVLGRDTGGGGNTDTMLLASYDVTNQKAKVMSIPRDTMVNVPWDVKRINSVYNYYGGGEKGIKALYKEISQLVGFEPDYQVIVEWDAVGAIVEAMGGVYYDVPRNMNYDDPYQDLHIHQTKGYRKLSGSDVMQVLRYRHDTDIHYGYPDGDLGRIKTQQSLLKAMIEQLLQLKNVTKIGDFARAVKNNVTSDLTFEEMLWFGSQAVMGGLKVEDVNFVTMPNTALYVYSRAYPRWPQNYVFPKAQELLDIVNNELSPFVEKFTMSDLDIMSLNSDGSLSSSTGHVEDSKAAVAPPVVVDRYSGDILGGTSSNSGTETNTGNGSETADGSETTDPGTTDPGNSGTVDPGTTDPGNSGTVDPGTTDPGNSGTTDPGTGEGGNTGDTGSGDTVVDEMPEWLRP